MISIVLPDARLHERLRPRLGDAHVRVWRPGRPHPPTGRVDLMVLPYMVPPEQLSYLQAVEVSIVQSQTLGYDGVADHLPAGIRYCNATDVHEASTAELAIALILAAQRGIPQAVRNGDKGRWDHVRQPGLAGKRVLLVGAGGVGRQIVDRLAPFDVELDIVARTARTGVRATDDLPQLLPGADVVVIAVPLHASTRRLVDDAFLSAMRDGALLVNVSRGEIVDTDALVTELGSGRLRAALDVTDPEPLPTDHPLWKIPGALITPHIGGDTDAMDTRIDRVVLEQIRRIREGETPLNLVFT